MSLHSIKKTRCNCSIETQLRVLEAGPDPPPFPAPAPGCAYKNTWGENKTHWRQSSPLWHLERTRRDGRRPELRPSSCKLQGSACAWSPQNLAGDRSLQELALVLEGGSIGFLLQTGTGRFWLWGQRTPVHTPNSVPAPSWAVSMALRGPHWGLAGLRVLRENGRKRVSSPLWSWGGQASVWEPRGGEMTSKSSPPHPGAAPTRTYSSDQSRDSTAQGPRRP